jgi:hypothetical protein
MVGFEGKFLENNKDLQEVKILKLKSQSNNL